MKFKQLEKNTAIMLSNELQDMAEEFMRDEYIKFNNSKKNLAKIEEAYNKLLDTEITEDFLNQHGKRIKESWETK